MVIYKIIEVFEQINGFGTLIYNGNYGTCTMEKKTMVLWKNYDTLPKNMALYRKLWIFNLLWKKIRYYGKNYGTIVNYIYI